jgi:hypothetical protein
VGPLPQLQISAERPQGWLELDISVDDQATIQGNFCQKKRDQLINAEALAYMRERAPAAHVIARLLEHPIRRFCDRKARNAHLDPLGITALEVNPDPVLIATEGALWGSVNGQQRNISRCCILLVMAAINRSRSRSLRLACQRGLGPRSPGGRHGGAVVLALCPYTGSSGASRLLAR